MGVTVYLILSFLLFGLLNNYYTFSRLEKVGKHYGGGVLKIQKYDLDNIMLTDIKLLSEKDNIINQLKKDYSHDKDEQTAKYEE